MSQFAKSIVSLLAVFSMLSLASAAKAELPHVVVLATGGTIASSADTTLSGDELIKQLHLEGTVRLDVKDVASGGSSNLGRADWAKLVSAIRASFRDPSVTGIVVTHGTDTLEETAFLLDLVIKEQRPLVLTGSMRSSDAVSADGPGNLIEAIRVAADPNARGLGTLVVLDDQIHSAVAVTKSDSNRLSAFVSANAGPLGVFSEGRPHFFDRPFASHPRWPLAEDKIATLPRVEIVTAEFDGDAMLLDASLKGGAKAIVIAGFGSGTITAPMRRFVSLYGPDLPIIISARVPAGIVKQAYSGKDDETGSAPRSGRLNPAKARVLAMVALAAGVSIDQRLFDEF